MPLFSVITTFQVYRRSISSFKTQTDAIVLGPDNAKHPLHRLTIVCTFL